MSLEVEVDRILDAVGVDASRRRGGSLAVTSPIDGSAIGAVAPATPADVEAALQAASAAFLDWRTVPAPRRGELVRRFGDELRRAKRDLGLLVTLETGKIVSEGLGEVQEMIDICDFAVGLSRQLHGLTIASERRSHRMMETWHPLGVCGVVSAFNFPVAVWAWNAALALVCGDPVVWKPSEKTPLTALAVDALLRRAIASFAGDADAVPPGLAALLVGGREVAAQLVDDPRVALVSATGSTAMGRAVGPRVAARFGRSLLELGGNNAGIVRPSADLDLALRAIAFAAMGTAGQRCTTLRRLFVAGGIYDQFMPRLKRAFATVRVGDPREAATLVGPLIDRAAGVAMQAALDEARALGGQVTGGEPVDRGGRGTYARPALVELPAQCGPMLRETFAPILYVVREDDLERSIAAQNAVGAGLSSCIFTRDLREAERFLSAAGSDCGIANVNIGPSGAEIGGAFGGEKETGGGRESGSDAWKAYMRRATNTINYGDALPLAQGVRFDVEG
ncbi:MAG TPA: aldehyde dehydrogenase family protein [Burkholderiaceae bacterium]|nr:aldehyde dehydrogenase family protein [Burkholderiaceae bacterium]